LRKHAAPDIFVGRDDAKIAQTGFKSRALSFCPRSRQERVMHRKPRSATYSVVAAGLMGAIVSQSWFSALGCSGVDEVDTTALCDDTIQAISQRTLACSGDRDLANARFSTLKNQAVCKTGVPVGPGTDDLRFHCAQAIQLVPCTEVSTRGDNLRAWLTDSSCSQEFDLSGQDAGLSDAPDGGAP
jgi:hypothetical protein